MYGNYRCECKYGYNGKNCYLGKYNCYVILNVYGVKIIDRL